MRFVALAFLLSAACQEQPIPDDKRTTLANMTQQNPSYYYTRSFGSWSGYSEKTTVTVAASKVVVRGYESRQYDQTTTANQYTVLEHYEETGADIGTHQNGAAPKTLPELYDECDDILSRDPMKYEFFLTFDGNSILKECVSVDKGCIDDCSEGITLEIVKFATLETADL